MGVAAHDIEHTRREIMTDTSFLSRQFRDELTLPAARHSHDEDDHIRWAHPVACYAGHDCDNRFERWKERVLVGELESRRVRPQDQLQ